MKPSRWRRLLPLLVVLAFAAAVFLVWREVRPYGLDGMLQAVAAIPRDPLAVAGASRGPAIPPRPPSPGSAPGPPGDPCPLPTPPRRPSSPPRPAPRARAPP